MIRGVRFVHEGQGRQLTAHGQGEKLLLFLLFRPRTRLDLGLRRLNFYRAALLPALHFLIDAGSAPCGLRLSGLSVPDLVHPSLGVGPGAAKGFAYRSGKVELYNLREDPAEKHNIADRDGETARQMSLLVGALVDFEHRMGVNAYSGIANRQLLKRHHLQKRVEPTKRAAAQDAEQRAVLARTSP